MPNTKRKTMNLARKATVKIKPKIFLIHSSPFCINFPREQSFKTRQISLWKPRAQLKPPKNLDPRSGLVRGGRWAREAVKTVAPRQILISKLPRRARGGAIIAAGWAAVTAAGRL